MFPIYVSLYVLAGIVASVIAIWVYHDNGNKVTVANILFALIIAVPFWPIAALIFGAGMFFYGFAALLNITVLEANTEKLKAKNTRERVKQEAKGINYYFDR